MSDHQPVLACDLGALSGEEQTRRSTVAARVSARFHEVRETSDGYAARLDPETQLVQDALDELRLDDVMRVGDVIDRLRARSFGFRGFAWYEVDGERVYANLRLGRSPTVE